MSIKAKRTLCQRVYVGMAECSTLRRKTYRTYVAVWCQSRQYVMPRRIKAASYSCLMTYFAWLVGSIVGLDLKGGLSVCRSHTVDSGSVWFCCCWCYRLCRQTHASGAQSAWLLWLTCWPRLAELSLLYFSVFINSISLFFFFWSVVFSLPWVLVG